MNYKFKYWEIPICCVVFTKTGTLLKMQRAAWSYSSRF